MHTRALSREAGNKPPFWKRWFERDDSVAAQAPPAPQEDERPGIARRLSRKVVPGLPRPGTFKRQQSELRDRLEPAKQFLDERRTLSVDRRRNTSRRKSVSLVAAHQPRLSAPELFEPGQTIDGVLTSPKHVAISYIDEVQDYVDIQKDALSEGDGRMSPQLLDDVILEELKDRWILNLSMHFRDKSNREKFFVTYAETPTRWRRVTISLDYRNTMVGSLEEELQRTKFQRDKSARIYEAIRESLADIQFYDTVTNLKLQTENERLHVHVVEDLSEIINFPPVTTISHLRNCRRFREEQLVFDSHLSGFVYKVKVDAQVYIKKEIPGPDTVDEFLYEINALHQLSGSRSVIQFGGVVLDNRGEYVKGLLIGFAEQGALIDVIYDGDGQIGWNVREKWARQIVQGLSEIHEAGFVQGDFTLSNIVIDEHDNAKIIDINRRGCPVGWEPPEVAALIGSNQRISMYIGVKSDLYQLGMVLYALAMQEDEPENQRPLNVSRFPSEVPGYFLDVCDHCLDDDPRRRLSATTLLGRFPHVEEEYYIDEKIQPIIVETRSPPLSPQYHDMHFDRLHTSGRGDGYFDHYATTETSEEMYPRRGRSPRRSPTPPIRKYVEPKDVGLPPSVEGSEYHDFAYDSPVTHEMPAAVNLGSVHDESFRVQQSKHETLTPISEISPDHEASTRIDNQNSLSPMPQRLDCSQSSDDPRKTAAEAHPMSPPTPAPTITERANELAGIGHEHMSPDVPATNFDDEFTTDMHHESDDRNVLDLPAIITTTSSGG